MATMYRFRVDPCGAKLELSHNLVFPDTWTDQAASDKLLVGTGNVDSSSNTSRLICHSGPPDKIPVLTLIGAGWTSTIGDKGAPSCNSCENTPDVQSWALTAKK
jgi:hypothetical protein